MNQMYNKYFKKYSLICTECNCISGHTVSMFFDDIEFDNSYYMELSNFYFCKYCNKMTYQIDVDPDIDTSVRILRVHEYDTRFSCAGHVRIYYDTESSSYKTDTSLPYIAMIVNKDTYDKGNYFPENFEKMLNVANCKVRVFNYEYEEGKESNDYIVSIGPDIDTELMDKYFNGEIDINEYADHYNKIFKEADVALYGALLSVFTEVII